MQFSDSFQQSMIVYFFVIPAIILVFAGYLLVLNHRTDRTPGKPNHLIIVMIGLLVLVAIVLYGGPILGSFIGR